MKISRSAGVILITQCDIHRGAYVTDDFGNLVKQTSEQLDDSLDRFLNAMTVRQMELPC